MNHKHPGYAPLLAALALASTAAAEPDSYGFTADGAPTGDPELASHFSGATVSGTFDYDATTPSAGALPNGATLYPGSITGLQAAVGGLAVTDPAGLLIVGNDRFFGASQGDGIVYAADPAIDSGAPEELFNLAGFETGDFRLINVRLFWLEVISGGDFLSDQLLPARLPDFTGRLALDFVSRADPADRRSVFFDNLRLEAGVVIDIKPGSDPNCFNPDGHGVIPVAIMGSASFDVTRIDPGSLEFGGLAVRVRGNRGPLCDVDYVNADGQPDLVCHFEDETDGWTEGSDSATLTGRLDDGSAFRGSDSICIRP